MQTSQASREAPKGSNWISFYIFLSGDCNHFLVSYFLPYLLSGANSDFKRFFFIRYTEGGMHLRMRFVPRNDSSPTRIETSLADLVAAFDRSNGSPPGPCAMQQEIYDRSALYFGENLLSVYSELLNEQTSYLALRFLRSHGDKPRHLIVAVASTIFALLHLSSKESDGILKAHNRSLSFAEGVLLRLGIPIPAPNEQQAGNEYLIRHLPNMAQRLKQDLVVQRIARLLNRARRLPAPNFVSVHALHLFCNKMGLSITEEYKLFRALTAPCQQTV